MIEVTTRTGKIYINPFWIEVVRNYNGTTRIFIYGDDSGYYDVAESAEEVIKKIEDDRRCLNETY